MIKIYRFHSIVHWRNEKCWLIVKHSLDRKLWNIKPKIMLVKEIHWLLLGLIHKWAVERNFPNISLTCNITVCANKIIINKLIQLHVASMVFFLLKLFHFALRNSVLWSAIDLVKSAVLPLSILNSTFFVVNLSTSDL